MSIATEKLKPSSERFMLVKITPARYVNDDLSSIGGSQYQMTFPFSHLSGIKRNGLPLALVTTITANDQYTFNDATNEVTIQIASAPSTSNIIIVFHDLFFTGSKNRYLPKDPESAESTLNHLVEWSPRILKYPMVQQTIRNIAEGILSYSSTKLSLANEGDFFDDYLTSSDSFSNKDISIWQCINTAEHIQLVFSGKMREISISNSKMHISIFDPFSKFSETAHFNDYAWECIFQRNSGAMVNLNPDDDGKPIRYWTATTTHKSTLQPSASNPPNSLIYDGQPASCIGMDLVNPPSTSNNRNYILCRVGPNGLKVSNYGTTVRQVAFGTKSRLYKLTGHNLITGDPFVDSGTYGYVAYAGDDFTYLSNDYNVIIENVSATALPPTNLSTVSTIETPPVLYHDTGSSYTFLWWGLHYTWGWTTTRTGNKLITIALNGAASSPETYWGLDPIDPRSHEIYFMLQPADTFTHGNFIKKMCTDSGIAVNASSFTAADSALSAKVHMSVPAIYESKYRPISGYIEDVLKSTLGYLTINKDNEAEYHLLATPASSGEQIDNTAALNKSVSERIVYSDIKTEVIAKNLHIPQAFGIDPSTSVASNKSRFLHEMDTVFELQHVLDSISSRINAISSLRGSTRHKYSLDVATQLVDSKIGDDVTFTEKSTNLKITNVRKTGSKVSIDADDLGEL